MDEKRGAGQWSDNSLKGWCIDGGLVSLANNIRCPGGSDISTNLLYRLGDSRAYV